MITKRNRAWGASSASMLMGIGLIAIGLAGAMKLLGLTLQSQNRLDTAQLVDQVSRISEIVSIHLNRGGSFQNPDVEAKGIQVCNLAANTSQCNGYRGETSNFCLSIPSRVTQSGRDVINLTGFRLTKGVLAQRDLIDINMAGFSHANFCSETANWIELNNTRDFLFPEIRFCRFNADTAPNVTQNYETNCSSVLAPDPETNMFWLALFKARISSTQADEQYEEARIIHLLNTTRVREGT